MSRKGLDPVSRKTKTPGGRKKSGFCVYLAYQLMDSVTLDQMVGESVNKQIDLGYKKKQLLGALTGTKLVKSQSVTKSRTRHTFHFFHAFTFSDAASRRKDSKTNQGNTRIHEQRTIISVT